MVSGKLQNENMHSPRRPLLAGRKPNTPENDDVEAAVLTRGDDCGNASFFNTCFNTLNALSGVGILSIPYALASGGWLSLALLFILAASAYYSGLLLKTCMDADTNIRTYPDICERAFGRKARILISVIMYAELYTVAVGFLILEGDNLLNLFPDVAGGKQVMIAVVALIILPTVWLNNMAFLSYVSASGVLASAIILGSISWVGAFDGVGFEHKGVLIDWTGIPTAVSLYAFCYAAHPIFPTIYTSMREKHQFSNVLLVCFIFSALSYTLMAVFGYLMFGDQVQSQITLNLPIQKLSSKVAIYTTLVNPITKYALMVLPIINALKSRFPLRKRGSGIIIGTALVISTVVVALAVPFFAYLMSLSGALFGVTASIIIPCLCYLKISETYQRFGFETLVLGTIMLMGVAVMFVGTYTALLEIIAHL